MVVPSPRVTRTGWPLALVVALAALLTYANSIPNGFAFDDLQIIEKNHQLRFLTNLPRFFRQDYFEPSMRLGLYRPLVVSSYALNMAVLGDGPLGFHVVNVVLHALNTALLALLVLRLTRDPWLAAGTGFLFAAHAVHSEAVANVTFGRPELLAACFGLLTLHLWIAAERSAGTRAKLSYAASLLCFGLALLSKENAVTILAVAVLVDWLYTERGERRSTHSLFAALRDGAGRTLGLALVAVALVGVRVWALGAQAMPPVPFVDNPLGVLPLGWRLINATLVALRYGGLLLLPVTLCSDYSYDTIPLVQSFDDPALWLGVVLLLPLFLLFVWSRRHDREIFFGLAFLAVTFSTASNLVVPIGTILGERLLYLPSAGFCMALTRIVQRLAGRLPGPASRRRALLAALIALATLLHGVRAVLRNPVWRDQHTLALHDVEIHPRSVKLQTSAGAAYWDLGRPELALAHFDAAIAAVGVTPDRFLNPFQGRVRALVDLGRWQEALALYEEVVRYGPRNLEVESDLAAAANAARAGQEEPPGP